MRLTYRFGRLFGVDLGVHISWFAVFIFITLSIAQSITAGSRVAHIGVAASCAVLLFTSVIAHEFAHALVARRYGVRTRAITLFLFGGVAQLESEPPSPRAEVMIALAGPALSALIAALCFGLLALIERVAAGRVYETLVPIVAYLALANGVLAVFNLVPAFPMDGGRVLRAALWRARDSRAAATGAASIVGLGLAATLVATGIFSTLVAHNWRAAWFVLIGVFLLRQGWLQLADSRSLEQLERIERHEHEPAIV